MVFDNTERFGTIDNSSILSFGCSELKYLSIPFRWPAPTTAKILLLESILRIFCAKYSSLSSIKTSPAPGENSFNSFIKSVRISRLSRISSKLTSTSSSSSPSIENIILNFSRNFIFRHALRRVTCISLSINSTCKPKSSDKFTASSNSAPGC